MCNGVHHRLPFNLFSHTRIFKHALRQSPQVNPRLQWCLRLLGHGQQRMTQAAIEISFSPNFPGQLGDGGTNVVPTFAREVVQPPDIGTAEWSAEPVPRRIHISGHLARGIDVPIFAGPDIAIRAGGERPALAPRFGRIMGRAQPRVAAVRLGPNQATEVRTTEAGVVGGIGAGRGWHIKYCTNIQYLYDGHFEKSNGQTRFQAARRCS